MKAQEGRALFIDTNGNAKELNSPEAATVRTVFQILARARGYQSPIEDFIRNLIICYEAFEGSGAKTWEPEDFRKHVELQLEQFDENFENLREDIQFMSTRYRVRLLKAMATADVSASRADAAEVTLEAKTKSGSTQSRKAAGGARLQKLPSRKAASISKRPSNSAKGAF